MKLKNSLWNLLQKVKELLLQKASPSLGGRRNERSIYTCAEIFKQFMGPMNRVGIELLFRPARARIFTLLRSTRIDSKEPIPPAYVARARTFKCLWGPGIDAKE
jgi:hypothetical protein